MHEATDLLLSMSLPPVDVEFLSTRPTFFRPFRIDFLFDTFQSFNRINGYGYNTMMAINGMSKFIVRVVVVFHLLYYFCSFQFSLSSSVLDVNFISLWMELFPEKDINGHNKCYFINFCDTVNGPHYHFCTAHKRIKAILVYA